MARLWVDAINRHGGDATFVSLPEIGIRGNTHFAFSDLNNYDVADQIEQFLAGNGLACADKERFSMSNVDLMAHAGPVHDYRDNPF